MSRGRPSLGITKKVSLTLTAEEWVEIESSGLTVAAFLKEQMKQPDTVQEPTPPAPAAVSTDREPVNYPRRYVEERWESHLRHAEELPPADILETAEASLFGNLFPKDAENAIVRTHQQYECPFTGKRYGSMNKLVRAAIPHLIEGAIHNKQHKIELARIREREKAPKYLMD